MRQLFIGLLGLIFIIVPVSAQAAPDAVASSFLENWKNHSYDSMYNQISERSRALTTFPVFETLYRETTATLGMEDLTFTVHDFSIQGTSAAINYDLTVESGIFGTIDDQGRIMRLVQEAGSWRVAWSPMDIFDGMTGSSELRLSGQREPRANIYDRNGLPLVEQNGTVIELYVIQQEIPNQAVCLDVLADMLYVQRQDLADFFARYNADSVFYVGDIDDEVYNARQGELSENCAVRTAERQTRNYFRGAAVSHVTGYIGQIPSDDLPAWQARGYSSGELVGLSGIERAFEEQLSGQPARSLQIVDSGGTVIRELGQISGTPPSPVTLTIDRALQHELAEALADAYNYAENNWARRDISTGAAAVVIDVNTGAILAMSSYPMFDPGIFNPDTPCCTFIPAGDRIAELVSARRTPLLNRVFQQQYAPGSVYKITTTAAVAAEELMGPNEIFDCTLTWDGAPFGDDVGFSRVDWRVADGLEATGPVTISDALASSCDPFYYQMGAILYDQGRGANTLIDYSRRMGLGEATGINYYGPEAAGELPTPSSVSEAINNAIGQGNVKVTPIQMARLTAGIANGGTVYKPYLVQRIGGGDFTPIVFEAEPEVAAEMELSAEVLEIVREGMCAVTTIEDLGTAVAHFNGTGYWACGKTGTSQTNQYPNAWFVAYAPRENPEIAVAVIGEQSREGSDVAAPIVRRIMDFYFNEPWNGYPLWWYEEEYIPLEIPVGATGG